MNDIIYTVTNVDCESPESTLTVSVHRREIEAVKAAKTLAELLMDEDGRLKPVSWSITDIEVWDIRDVKTNVVVVSKVVLPS